MKRLCCMVLLLCLFPVFSCAESELRGFEEALLKSYLNLYSLPAPNGPGRNGNTTVFVCDDYMIVLTFNEEEDHFVRGLLSYYKPLDYDFVGVGVCMIRAFFGTDYMLPFLEALAHFHGESAGIGFANDQKDAVYVSNTDEGFPVLLIKLNWNNQ